MGTSYKGGADHYHSISENIPALKGEYPYHDGYFGTKGDSSTNSRIRHIQSPNPKETAKEFYDKLTHGGVEEPIYDKKTGIEIGKKTYLSDGSIISWRNVSHSDGTPAVDINIERSSDSGGIKQQRIHFVI